MLCSNEYRSMASSRLLFSLCWRWNGLWWKILWQFEDIQHQGPTESVKNIPLPSRFIHRLEPLLPNLQQTVFLLYIDFFILPLPVNVIITLFIYLYLFTFVSIKFDYALYFFTVYALFFYCLCLCIYFLFVFSFFPHKKLLETPVIHISYGLVAWFKTASLVQRVLQYSNAAES